MREILFRGKRTDNGEFIEGCLCKNIGLGFSIMPKAFFGTVIFTDEEETQFNQEEDGLAIGGFFSVIPESVGQFTGLTDKNGTKIFEGDIVRILYTDWASKSNDDPRTLEEYLISISDVGKVVFNTDRWELEFVSSIYPEEVYTDSIRCGPHGRIEVIGNIHDNPELLK